MNGSVSAPKENSSYNREAKSDSNFLRDRGSHETGETSKEYSQKHNDQRGLEDQDTSLEISLRYLNQM